MGSAPQPAGGSGVGALPPGGGALAPAGVFGGAMPALGGGAAARGKSPVDLAFDNIMALMPQLDSLMIAMRNVPQEKIMALALTESERFALQNDALHERFLKLRRGADDGGRRPGAGSELRGGGGEVQRGLDRAHGGDPEHLREAQHRRAPRAAAGAARRPEALPARGPLVGGLVVWLPPGGKEQRDCEPASCAVSS